MKLSCQIQTYSAVFLIQLQPFSSAETPVHKGKGSSLAQWYSKQRDGCGAAEGITLQKIEPSG